MTGYTMKEIPKEDRPYEKCCLNGPGSLTDAELLAIIIRTGSRTENSLELASRILALNYPETGILGLLHHSIEEWKSIPGIGDVKAVQLQCVGELSKRIWKKSMQDELCLMDPASIADYCKEEMRHLEQEEMWGLYFNNRQVLLKSCCLFRGTVNASMVSPREILIHGLKAGAVSMVLIHNHPSGVPSPSREDQLITRRMQEAGKLIGIGLIDHIIIGDNCYYSFKERGII